jgi:signal transduction histidine kinase
MPTVLVVDDEPLNRKLLRNWLEKEGHRVVEAADGPSALAAVERHSPDAVLLDVMMPGMSGIEVLKTLRARPIDGFLPVVLLTALGDQEHRNIGLAAGADDYLGKPVDRHELALRLRGLLRIRAQDAQIRAQVDQLRQLDALKNDLVDLLAHDLRNPLAGLSALLDRCRREVDGRLREDLDAAWGAALRAHDLLDDMLRIRRLEEVEWPLDLAPNTLGEIVLNASVAYGPAAKARGVEVVVEAVDDPELSVDTDLLRRAVENLVVNAIRFAPEKTPVEVRIRSRDDGVELTVSDRGPGLDEATAARLFERYGTVGSLRPGRKGFGLGLYLVRLAASAHGGRAWASKRQGGGAQFHLWLPRAARDSPRPPSFAALEK